MTDVCGCRHQKPGHSNMFDWLQEEADVDANETSNYTGKGRDSCRYLQMKNRQ